MKNLKGNVFFKIGIILVLILLLLIPTLMVQQLIHERENVQQRAIYERMTVFFGPTIKKPKKRMSHAHEIMRIFCRKN